MTLTIRFGRRSKARVADRLAAAGQACRVANRTSPGISVGHFRSGADQATAVPTQRRPHPCRRRASALRPRGPDDADKPFPDLLLRGTGARVAAMSRMFLRSLARAVTRCVLSAKSARGETSLASVPRSGGLIRPTPRAAGVATSLPSRDLSSVRIGGWTSSTRWLGQAGKLSV